MPESDKARNGERPESGAGQTGVADDGTANRKVAKMTFGAHLEELRRRLFRAIGGIVIATIGAFIFSKTIYNFMEGPIRRLNESATVDVQIVTQFIEPTEMFLALINVSLLAGLAISSPYVLWQLWQFVREGLYRRERRIVHVLAPMSTVLFLGGLAFCYYVILPIVIRFLVRVAEGTNAEAHFRVSSIIGFFVHMEIIFGIAFQVPLVVMMLSRLGIVRVSQFMGMRKFVIAGSFILAAVMTPPDPASCVLLAVPLWVLFELGIVLGRIVERKPEASA